MAEFMDSGEMQLIYSFLMSPVSTEPNSLAWGVVLIALGVILFVAISAGK